MRGTRETYAVGGAFRNRAGRTRAAWRGENETVNYYRMAEVLFRAWYANWATVAVANDVALGLGLPETGAITTAQTNYANSVSAMTAAHDAAKAATNTKNEAYAAAFALVQQWANQWQADPAVSQELILELGLNIRDTTPSPRPIFAVTDVVASGNAVGTVRMKWNRGANLPGCNFIVQSRPVGGTEWSFVTVTTKTRLAIGALPITATEMRVITERRGILSEPSESTVVYGEVGGFAAAGSPTLTLLEDAA